MNDLQYVSQRYFTKKVAEGLSDVLLDIDRWFVVCRQYLLCCQGWIEVCHKALLNVGVCDTASRMVAFGDAVTIVLVCSCWTPACWAVSSSHGRSIGSQF